MAAKKLGPPKRIRQEVTIALGAGADAPNFRNAMTEDAALAATFPNAGVAIVAPADAPRLFDAHRLASRGDNLERMWQILAGHPRLDQETEHKQAAIDAVNAVAELATAEGMLWGIGLLLLITSNAEVRPVLEQQLDSIWSSLPEATLWLVTAERPLMARLTMSQLLFQFEHTPDLGLDALMAEPRRSLEAQSLMGRVATSDVVQPIFLAFSPAATGFAAPWLPHTIALEFGGVRDIREDPPISLSAVYDPRVLSPPADREGRPAWGQLGPEDEPGDAPRVVGEASRSPLRDHHGPDPFPEHKRAVRQCSSAFVPPYRRTRAC